jgi:hypothetical protein
VFLKTKPKPFPISNSPPTKEIHSVDIDMHDHL